MDASAQVADDCEDCNNEKGAAESEVCPVCDTMVATRASSAPSAHQKRDLGVEIRRCEIDRDVGSESASDALTSCQAPAASDVSELSISDDAGDRGAKDRDREHASLHDHSGHPSNVLASSCERAVMDSVSRKCSAPSSAATAC